MQDQSSSKSSMDIPILDIDWKNFNNWKLKVDNFCFVSKEPKTNLALLIQSKLHEKAFNITKGLSREILRSDGGVAALIEKLEKFYVPDKLAYGREWCDKYRDLRRQDGESVVDFLQKFDDTFIDFKKFNADVEYPDHIVAWDLIRALNMNAEDTKIVTAQMTYPPTTENLIGILNRVFTTKKEDKAEPDYSKNKASDIFLSKSRANTEWDQDQNYPHSSLYARGNKRPTYRPPRRGRFVDRNVPYNRNSDTRRFNTSPRKNMIGSDGKIKTCSYCESEWHFFKSCPKLAEVKKEPREPRKHSNNFLSLISFVGCASKNDDKMQDLLDETKGYALLDSGCSNTVAGEKWMENFIANLSAQEKKEIKVEASHETFTFGDGITKKALRKLTFPCWIGGDSCEITADIVDCKIPLLLSRKSMSKASMIINFAKHTAFVNDRAIKLKRTRSGHYGLPISL